MAKLWRKPLPIPRASVDYNNEHTPSLLGAAQFKPRTFTDDSNRLRPVDRFRPGAHRVLGTFGLVCITYFIGCGGPLGSEPVISSAGPLIGLSSMLVYPLVVVVPYGFILAELCTAFPEDGGFVVWALNAFGPFWGFQIGYWSWIGGAFNCAILPGLMMKLLHDAFGFQISSAVVRYLVQAGVTTIVAIPAFFGSKWVERSCIVLITLVIVPMVVFTVWGYAVGDDYADLKEIRRDGDNIYDEELEDVVVSGGVDIKWPLLLNTLFWNFDGIAMVSVFGGEVANPARVYPRALAFTIVLMVTMYVVPMPAGIVTETPHWSKYERDSYPFIAFTIGGSVLQAFVLVASMAGIVGTFLSGMYCKSFQVCGMAESRLLPQQLGVRNQRFDSPHVSVALTLCFTLTLISIEFQYLLPVANVFLCGVQLLIIASAIRLRIILPYITRPTKVPGGIWVLMLLGLPPAGMLTYIMFDALRLFTPGIVIGTLLVPGIAFGMYKHFHNEGSSSQSPVMFA